MAIPVNDGLLEIFNVEHGACALFTIPHGMGFKRLMIDCGHNATTGWTPARHLRRLGTGTLERLVITNYDEDHVSGYKELMDTGVFVEWLWRNESVSANTIRQLKSEDGMGRGIDAFVASLATFNPPSLGVTAPEFPGLTMQLFWNSYPAFDDENNLSLVLLLTYRGLTVMFPGDMECAGFEYLLRTDPTFAAALESVNVLVASHHGRKNGICPAMFDTWHCKPQFVVISDDYRQYDTQETTNYYASKCGAGLSGFRGQSLRKVLTTRKDGDIAFSWSGQGCTVL
jgi:beta-lactamase superfamily II metal-dependent hydrolase